MYSQYQPEVEKSSLFEKMKKFSTAPKITPVDADFQTIVKGEIWAVDNFLTAKECEFLIEASENAKYTDALINTGIGRGVLSKDIRDSKRAMLDDESITDYLYEKCKLFAPAAFGGAVLNGVNERLRFLKYDHAGADFKQHVDGMFIRGNEQSLITLQIYLNDKMKGGCTTFYDDKAWKNGSFSYQPKVGSCLIFRQDDWVHEGSPIESGVKYTIRTELMYKSLTPDEVKDWVHQKCNLCGSTTRFVELKSCDDPFVMCNCIPFNFHSRAKGYCLVCQKSAILPDNIRKKALTYSLGE